MVGKVRLKNLLALTLSDINIVILRPTEILLIYGAVLIKHFRKL